MPEVLKPVKITPKGKTVTVEFSDGTVGELDAVKDEPMIAFIVWGMLGGREAYE